MPTSTKNRPGRPRSLDRPALRYYGSGWARAAWTVAHFPAHRVYCEPCFGAGAVLYHKQPAKLEIANDLDGRVITFFQQLRDNAPALVAAINATPYHEAEFRRALVAADDPLEDARRFFVSCWCSVKGGPAAVASDYRWGKKHTRRNAPPADIRDPAWLHRWAERLRAVQFMQRDALDLIERMAGTGALIYFDPPYLASTRANMTGYRLDVTADWHERAAALLRAHDGPALVAGYQSAEYRVLYEAAGWERAERQALQNSGGRAVDCLWLNPAAVEGLRQQGPPERQRPQLERRERPKIERRPRVKLARDPARQLVLIDRKPEKT